MMLRRDRHVELDKFRSLNHDFNFAWLMFFGTKPPGIHQAGVFFTEQEKNALTYDMSGKDVGSKDIKVEPYDARLRRSNGMGHMHGCEGETS